MSSWKPEIQWWPADRPKPYARNAKQHPKEQLDKIARQIHEHGFTQPILVGKDDVILAGHGRLEAARSLGLTEVPVIVADHLTDEQEMALRIADNKVAESGWDMPMLAFELGTLDRREIDLTLSGFDMGEARAILGSFAGGESGGGGPGGSSSGSGSQGAQDRTGDGDKSFAHQCPKCGFEFD